MNLSNLKSNQKTELCPSMRIGSNPKGKYDVYCSAYDDEEIGCEYNIVCSISRCLFEPPYPGETKRPHTRESVEGFCPRQFTAEQVYEKIKALEKKLVSEIEKDQYSLDNFERPVNKEVSTIPKTCPYMELSIMMEKIRPACTWQGNTSRYMCKMALSVDKCPMQYKIGDLSELYFPLLKKFTLKKSFLDSKW